MDECGIYGVLHTIDGISGVVQGSGEIQGQLNTEGVLVGSVGFPNCPWPDEYTGAYEVTPTQSTQILNTADLVMSDNVVINPIPSNYGLVTWNGSVLTVS